MSIRIRYVPICNEGVYLVSQMNTKVHLDRHGAVNLLPSEQSCKFPRIDSRAGIVPLFLYCNEHPCCHYECILIQYYFGDGDWSYVKVENHFISAKIHQSAML